MRFQQKVLILAANVLASPLKILFNYAFEFGTFPDSSKTAKIIPSYKQEDETKMGNYRPLFTLSTFSKIVEKLICNKPNHV